LFSILNPLYLFLKVHTRDIKYIFIDRDLPDQQVSQDPPGNQDLMGHQDEMGHQALVEPLEPR
jgi:hypothetical protein